jgi:hypothetical protein
MCDKDTMSTIINDATTLDKNGGRLRLKGHRYRWMMLVKSSLGASFYESVPIDGIQMIISEYWGPRSPSFDVTHIGSGVELSHDGLEAWFVRHRNIHEPGAALGAEPLGMLCYVDDEKAGGFSVCLKRPPHHTSFYVGVSHRDVQLNTNSFEIGVFASCVGLDEGRTHFPSDNFTAGFSPHRTHHAAESPENFKPCAHHKKKESHFVVTVRFDLDRERLSFMVGDQFYADVYGPIPGLAQMHPYVESTQPDNVARFVSTCQLSDCEVDGTDGRAVAAPDYPSRSVVIDPRQDIVSFLRD